MTAATVHLVPTVAEVLDLAQPTAITLATLPTDERRAAATRAARDRRTALALYVDLYAERYGHRLDLSAVEAGDEVLVELLLLTVA